MQNLREILWYTIPGALAIAPLMLLVILLNKFPIQNLGAGATVGLLIFFSLPLGFLLNQIWYLCWNYKGGYARKDRKNLQFILEQLELKKEEKNFKLAYLIWDYWIYKGSGDRGIKELSDKARDYWTSYHSCGTCIIAFFVGIGLILQNFHSFPYIQRFAWLPGYIALILILEASKRQLWDIVNKWELMIAESNISDILILNHDIIDAARKTRKRLESEEEEKKKGKTEKKTDK